MFKGRIITFYLITCLAFNSFSLKIDSTGFNTRIYKVGLPVVPGLMQKNINGSVKGFPLEVFESAAKDEGINFVWIEGPWGDLYEMVLKGTIDVLPGTQITPERKLYLDFIENSLNTIWSELYLPKGKELKSLNELSEKKIGFIKGDNNALGFEKYIRNFNISYRKVYIESHEAGISMLTNDEIFALVGPSANLMTAQFKNITSSGLYFNPTSLSIAFPKGKNEELRIKIDQRISKYKKDASSIYNRLYHEYGLSTYNNTRYVFPVWLQFTIIIISILVITGLFFLILLRKQIQIKTLSLIQRETLLRRTLEIGNMATWEVDVIRWKFYLSPKIFNLLGYDKVPKISLDFIEEVIYSADREYAIDVLRNSVKTGENFDAEFRTLKKGGEVLFTRQIGMIIKNEKEKVVKVLGIMQNITPQKEYELELIKAKEKAEESEKLKSVFLANMSHEIRTPLNAIVGFSDLITHKNLTRSKKEKFNAIIHEQNKLLLNLINDVIDFAKIESGSLPINIEKQVNINHLIENVYESIKSQCPDNVDFKLNILCNEEVGYLNIDSIRLKQILNNLVINAFKYTFNGFVELGCRFIEENLTVCIYVKDTGIGISGKEKEVIFNRFYQSNTMSQGTGLGLSISKSLAEIMGGDIKLISEVDVGSEFILTFPINNVNCDITSNNMDHVRDDQLDLSSINLKNREALVVEDLMSNYLLLETVLESIGAKITWAQNGAEAVEVVEEKTFDVILMDLKMPVMDGFTATKKIREKNIETPIIAVTAYVFDSDREKALNAGCIDYISKPIDRDELVETIGRALGIIN